MDIKKNLDKFYCVNRTKFARAEQIASEKKGFSDYDILVEYDKLQGLITQDGVKVKAGSFYDYENEKPNKEPKNKKSYKLIV